MSPSMVLIQWFIGVSDMNDFCPNARSNIILSITLFGQN